MSFVRRLLRFWGAAGPVRRVLVIAVLATIVYATYASLADNPVAPQAWDKGLHFVGYFGLMGLTGLALWLPRRFLPAAPILWFYSGLIELAQTLTLNRKGDLDDFIANGLGIFSALVVLAALHLISQRLLRAA